MNLKAGITVEKSVAIHVHEILQLGTLALVRDNNTVTLKVYMYWMLYMEMQLLFWINANCASFLDDFKPKMMTMSIPNSI